MRKITTIVLLFSLFISIVTPISAAMLTDIDSHWAKKEINALVEKEIINGYPDHTYRPNANVTRGQFVAFLVRALHLPEGDSGFVDVKAGNNLYEEINAAKKAGIIQGTVEGKALPNVNITRADAAVMLDRALQYKGNFNEESDLNFIDAGSVPKYALNAFKHVVHYGFVQGTKENTLDHASTATRAESAVFIYRLYTFMVEKGLLEKDTGTPGESVNLSPSEVQITMASGENVRVRMNTGGVPLSFYRKDTNEHLRSVDTHYYYKMGKTTSPLGELRVTLRTLDNGDTFVFTKFIHNGDNTYSASVILPFQDASSYDLKKMEEYGSITHEHNNTFGVDPTTHPIGLLTLENSDGLTNSVMLSKSYTSKQREKVYANGQKSVIREFDEELESYNIQKDQSGIYAVLNMKVLSKGISENWVLVSQKKLFEEQQYIDYWFERSVDEYRSINKWLTADGAYSKLPWSIEPGYKLGYGRNIGAMQGGIYLRAYTGSEERYFYNLVLNSIADLDVFTGGSLTKGDVPVFKTEYTSTWLKNAYGTTAPYIDTRHNENTALFLKNAGEVLNISKLSNANIKYADFLVNQKEIGNIIPITVSSHLIADYYAPGSKTTHVSLNHALGEMRFLIETYRQTGDDKYFKTARQLKAGIENLYPRWIRDDGNLWYQVNGDKVFNGTDYPTLTLVDLLLSQQLFEEISYPRSSIFDEMIKSKTTYLVNEKHPFKGNELELLREQGFGYLVESYGNVKASSILLEKDTLDLLAE